MGGVRQKHLGSNQSPMARISRFSVIQSKNRFLAIFRLVVILLQSEVVESFEGY